MVEQRVYGKLRVLKYKGRNLIYQIGVPSLRLETGFFGLELVVYGYEEKITELAKDFYDIRYEPLQESELDEIREILSNPKTKVSFLEKISR